MPNTILVVERGARDADRIRQALSGRPFTPSFVREGEEVLRALDAEAPRLIVLTSPDLIGMIRARPALRQTPILLTMDGYHGDTPKQEAMRLGATDMVSTPFSETEFVTKVEQLLTPRMYASRHVPGGAGQLTSSEIFADIVSEQPPQPKRANSTSDVDALLAKTLSDVMPKPRAKTPTGSSALDKKLQDTLSGLEKSARSSASIPPRSEKIHFSHPVLPPDVPAPAAPPAEEEEPVDGVRFGQYVLLEKIATGGMAEVWKARMRGVQGFQKIVAIKKILPHLSDNQEFVEMFVDEAKLAAQLSHNNIIHIYDLGHIQASYYIAMEFVDGYDLKTILKRAEERGQPLPEELALFVASRVAAALDYAHRKEIVHRDVSPQNVLISREGDIKLCDFGIAKAASKASHTQAGALKGKLQYMAPEQARGEAIDRRTDIFALGAVLFEMLTRRQLFTGDHEMSILEQVREGRVTPPSQFNDELSPETDAIVMKALQKDPVARYQTAAEMSKDIESLLYNYRPTPTSADLAIYMHRLDEAQAVARAEEPPPPQPAEEERGRPRPPIVAAGEDARAPIALTRIPEKKRSVAVIPIALAAVLAGAVAGGFFFVRRKAEAVTAPVAQPPAAAAASATVATVATETLAPAPVVATASEPVIDPAKVEEEVQRRLAIERARLEHAAAARVEALPASVPQPVVAAPVVVENKPQPQPAPVAPPPPAPEPAAERPQVKEGDLVTDSDGLIPARMLRRAASAYPPLARMQHVEGTVFVSVLVSETGAVLETKILRPIARPVGLNEAAESIVRRSTFSPPMKDGVRVKAWTTVPIEFKL